MSFVEELKFNVFIPVLTLNLLFKAKETPKP